MAKSEDRLIPTGLAPHEESGPRGQLAGPCAIAFVASACVMIVELLAFRLIARYLGSSNYTVTAIIGVILGGLAIGNVIGGRLADRFRAGRTLCVLFILSSASCFAAPILNKAVGEWPALWLLSWPPRIAIHVALTFALPAIVLGTTGPVVATMALERRLRVGRTVGSVYAFGAIGSIVGTFACGFFLIPRFGNYAVISSVAAFLAVIAIACDAKYWLPFVWALVSAAILAVGAGPWPWARSWGGEWGLREQITPQVLFDADSEYGHVRVEASHDVPGLRTMILDKLDHSYIDVQRPAELLYSYEQVYAAVTDYVAGPRQGIRALVLGGGGYTHPRHILRRRPESYVEVVEIDPVVTQAARAAFGLTSDPRLKIIHLDARQRLVDLDRRRGDVPAFDFVFLDAVNDFNVPFHLTTRECQSMVYSLLTDDGVFFMTLIDVMDVGGFLGSTLRTLGQRFPYVECFFAGVRGEAFRPDRRYTFVVVASKKDLDLDGLKAQQGGGPIAAQRLSREQRESLLQRGSSIVLTDDHAPVEHLLAGVVRHVEKDAQGWEAALKFYNRGNAESAQGRPADALVSYSRAVELAPTLYLAYLNMGLAHSELRQLDEAIASLETASRIRPEMPSPVLNLGGIYMLRHDYAAAAATYKRAVAIDPRYAPSHNALGKALANLGQLGDAKAAFQKALELNPSYEEARSNLARVEAVMNGSPASAPSPALP